VLNLHVFEQVIRVTYRAEASFLASAATDVGSAQFGADVTPQGGHYIILQANEDIYKIANSERRTNYMNLTVKQIARAENLINFPHLFNVWTIQVIRKWTTETKDKSAHLYTVSLIQSL
jgi:hypothetical protein